MRPSAKRPVVSSMKTGVAGPKRVGCERVGAEYRSGCRRRRGWSQKSPGAHTRYIQINRYYRQWQTCRPIGSCLLLPALSASVISKQRCMQHNDASLPMIKCEEVGGCKHPFSRGWYQNDCAKLDAIEAQSMVENDIPWICRYCTTVKKTLMYLYTNHID